MLRFLAGSAGGHFDADIESFFRVPAGGSS